MSLLKKAENIETMLNILDISFWFTLYIVLLKFKITFFNTTHESMSKKLIRGACL